MVAFTGLETPPPEATARLGLSKLVHLLDPTNAENLDMWGFSCESNQTLSRFSARLAKLLMMMSWRALQDSNLRPPGS